MPRHSDHSQVDHFTLNDVLNLPGYASDTIYVTAQLVPAVEEVIHGEPSGEYTDPEAQVTAMDICLFDAEGNRTDYHWPSTDRLPECVNALGMIAAKVAQERAELLMPIHASLIEEEDRELFRPQA